MSFPCRPQALPLLFAPSKTLSERNPSQMSDQSFCVRTGTWTRQTRLHAHTGISKKCRTHQENEEIAQIIRATSRGLLDSPKQSSFISLVWDIESTGSVEPSLRGENWSMPYVSNRTVRIHYEVEGQGPPCGFTIGIIYQTD